MKNKNLDQIIKNKLEQLDINDVPNWDMMESLLQHEGLLNDNIQSFDQMIKSSIEKEPTVGKDASWLQMAATLDLMDNLDDIQSQEVNDFDEIFKSKLNNVAVPLADWDAFSEKLDSTPENILDKITKEKLSNIPNDTNYDWAILAAKLAKEQSFKRRIIFKYKILESTVLVLLLFTFINFYPTYKNQLKSFLPNSAAFFSFNDKKGEVISDKSPKKRIPKIPKNTNQTIENNLVVEDDNILESFPNGATKIEIVKTPKPIHISAFNYKEINDVKTFKQTSISNAKTLSFETEPNKPSLLSRIFNKKEKNTASQNLHIDSPKHLENISLTALDFEKNKRLPNFLNRLKKIPFGITAGMLLAGNYNSIFTPSDDVLNVSAYRNTGLGYGAGFTMGFEFDKIEIHTGFIYKGYQYTPLGREIVGNTRVGVYSLRLNEININTLEIPLHLRYHFYDKNDWNLYAGAGATMGLVFQANYFLTTSEVRSPNQDLGERSASAYISNSDLHQDKIYNDGAFEGGSFNQNQFYSADISIGAELKLTKRWGIFMEHTYQYTLPSNFKSPNNDKINRYNVYLGVRSRLR